MVSNIGFDDTIINQNGSAAVDFDTRRGVGCAAPLHIIDEGIADRTGCIALDLNALGKRAASAVCAVDIAVPYRELAAVQEYAAAVEITDIQIIKRNMTGIVCGNIDRCMSHIRCRIVAEVLDLQVRKRHVAAARDEDVVVTGLGGFAVDRVKRFFVAVYQTGNGDRLFDLKFGTVIQLSNIRNNGNRLPCVRCRDRFREGRKVQRIAAAYDLRYVRRAAVRRCVHCIAGDRRDCRGPACERIRVLLVRCLRCIRMRRNRAVRHRGGVDRRSVVILPRDRIRSEHRCERRRIDYVGQACDRESVGSAIVGRTVIPAGPSVGVLRIRFFRRS